MELSLICPVKHIERTSLLTGRFCIAPIAMKHTVYKDYFVNAAIDGYKVMLDNGIFEDVKVQNEDYINFARYMQPRVLVIPDVINRGADANYYAALKFIDLVKEEDLNDSLREPIELMFVIQCEKDDTEGFWTGIANALTNPDMQWIGICRDAVYNAFSRWTHTEDQELNRFFFATRLQAVYHTSLILKKKWHFLGIGSRLDLLRHFWFVDAMDTASLFYQSTIRNRVTEEFFLPGSLKRPKDYFIRDFGHEGCWIDVLEHNCQAALIVAQQAASNKRRILGGRL